MCHNEKGYELMIKDKAKSLASKAICKISGHSWHGCKCTRCGEIRDEGHEYNQVEGKCEQKCTICESVETLPHLWDGYKCTRCGTTIGFAERFWDSIGKRLPFMHLEKKNNRILTGLCGFLVICFLFIGIMAVVENNPDSNSRGTINDSLSSSSSGANDFLERECENISVN